MNVILSPAPLGEPDILPPSDLTPESFADDLYEALAPLAAQDALYEWALLILCNAIGVMFQLVDEIVRDSPDGPGWSMMLDLDRCPSVALDWLGQYVGVRLSSDATDAEKIAVIRDMPGFRRGTPAAIIKAAQATLTGTKTVTLTERDGDPYYLTAATAAEETASVPATRAALLTQKPAGIILNYGGVMAALQTWDQLKTRSGTWSGNSARYTNWDNALYDVHTATARAPRKRAPKKKGA